MNGDLVYLDYAATAAVRPSQVVEAVSAYLSTIGATPGRGGHRLAVEAGRVALRCRRRLATLLDIPGDPGRIVFTAGATAALNTALQGVLRPGDAVVVTQLDHNAVLRPAALLAGRGVEVRLVPCDAAGRLDETALAKALQGARLFCINGASNVIGTVPDVGRLAEQARAAGTLTLLDAAQLAGHRPLSVADIGIDMAAFTGHKGLLGPQGIGALWVREGVDIDPLMAGGTGGDSLDRRMPSAFPDHLEAGTLNGPGIAGLLAGVDWLLAEDVAKLHQRLHSLALWLHDRLGRVPGVTAVSPAEGLGVPIVTMTAAAMDAGVLASRLDREHGVMVRAGLHCAPEIHRVLGTDRAGAVRFSLGWATRPEDVERAAYAVAAVVASQEQLA